MKKCPYETLTIPKNSSENDIKKAYRTLAVKYHPDKNPDTHAEEEFKKISEAYSILSDPEKKKVYDQYGWEGLSGGTPNVNVNSNFNPNPNINFNFNGNSFFNMFFCQRQKHIQKPQPINEKISITYQELYCGINKNIIVNKNVVCRNCYGSGSKDKKKFICNGCGGSGVKIETRQFGHMIQQFQSICNKCNGSGESIDIENIKDLCDICNGQKITLKSVLENITIKGTYPF